MPYPLQASLELKPDYGDAQQWWDRTIKQQSSDAPTANSVDADATQSNDAARSTRDVVESEDS